jgi:hypothetical protein
MRANSGRGHALIDRLVSLGSTVLYCTVQIQETDDSHHEGSRNAVQEEQISARGRCHNMLTTRADDGSVGENDNKRTVP